MIVLNLGLVSGGGAVQVHLGCMMEKILKSPRVPRRPSGLSRWIGLGPPLWVWASLVNLMTGAGITRHSRGPLKIKLPRVPGGTFAFPSG